MKILWYVNIVMPKAATAFGLMQFMGGGWLSAQADLLAQNNVDLHILNINSKVKCTSKKNIDGIEYILVPATKKQYFKSIQTTISELKPDIVHIFGTEYIYNIDIIQICNNMQQKFVVSIQGIMSECANHYMDGLPNYFKRISLSRRIMKKLYYADSIALEQRLFEKQGQAEIKALRTCASIIGRTHFDKAYIEKINPSAQYYCVNENLRDEFYSSDKWQYAKCKPHSIFISQGFYPIKGFHKLLKILPDLVKLYPDITVIVGGLSAYTLHNKILDKFVDYFFEYQSYIKKLIKQNNLQKYIAFTGQLNASNMIEQYLKCNVFVSLSSVENSPNSVCEAMMLGVPIIASNVGGTTSILRDKVDGLLYDFDDDTCLKNLIQLVFENDEKIFTLSQNAIKHAKITNDKSKNTQDLLSTYSSIVFNKEQA